MNISYGVQSYTRSNFGYQDKPAVDVNNGAASANSEMRDKLKLLSQNGQPDNTGSYGINSILTSSQDYAEQLRTQRQQRQSTIVAIKRIKYNYKSISSRILRSKTSLSARQAAGQARREAIRLRRQKLTNGEDSEELDAAINHAKAMERVALKKARHLEQEELAEAAGGTFSELLTEEDIEKDIDAELLLTEEDIEEYEDVETEIEAEIEADNIAELLSELYGPIDELLEDMGLSEITEAVAISADDMSAEDLKELKIKHRNKEMKEIVKADTEYLKAVFDNLAKDISMPEPVINITL